MSGTAAELPQVGRGPTTSAEKQSPWPDGVPVCPDRLHEHPLPKSYLAAGEEAERRLASGWKNRKCRKCGLYGWVKP